MRSPGFIALTLLLLGAPGTRVQGALQANGFASGARERSSAPRFHFVPLDTLRRVRFVVDRPPWAPMGTLLALEGGGDSLLVYDPERPHQPPRLVHRSSGRMHWSPDGRWIARLVAHLAPPFLPDTLLGVDTSTGAVDTLYVGKVWPYVWASDGDLYVWPEGEGGGPERLAPPKAWRASWTPPRTPRPTLILGQRWGEVSIGATRHRIPMMGLQRFAPGVHPRADRLPALDSLFRFENLLLEDALPERGLFLVSGPLSHGGRTTTLLVDDWGRLVGELPKDTTSWNPGPSCLISEGRIGLGAEVQSDGTEEGRILSARLVAIDVNWRWVVPIEGTGMGMTPWVSREGSFLAYLDPINGGICVGKLVIEPR